LFSGVAPKHYSTTTTTITRLEYFTGGLAEYKVMTTADVASIADVLASIIQDKIIPFFNKHEDVKALDKTINCELLEIDITQNPAGAMHAIILAHLAGNTDFDHIVAKHRSAMQLEPEVPHPFNRLVEYLKARCVEVNTIA
jgi:hypothetical protein